MNTLYSALSSRSPLHKHKPFAKADQFRVLAIYTPRESEQSQRTPSFSLQGPLNVRTNGAQRQRPRKKDSDTDNASLRNVLMCRCVELSLNNPHLKPYEALSYVWGNGSPTVAVGIWEGRPFHSRVTQMKIMSSLARALRRLREKTRVRYLWIDALCINLQDEAGIRPRRFL